MECKGKAIKRDGKGKHILGCDEGRPATHLLIKRAASPVLPLCDPCVESFKRGQESIRHSKGHWQDKPETKAIVLDAKVLPITPDLLEEYKAHL